ncbi:golgi apyrase [Moniliophthora roreri MCA 2997]|uniref:Golgi apyrase n=1 Tax=Moniliophthora roreri (strain MCA 2997) TaxID=1381753 RepID=V2XEX0_MONRO|nr:golgi apyrase [Moniliophthora roreri MCA 2997]
MPPPTAADPWLTNRHFGIVIDAGSSGSRLQIYSWKDPRTIEITDELAHTLPKVEKGTRDGEGWVAKVEPGISSLADSENPNEAVAAYLRPLLSFAYDHVPPKLHQETPLFLLATAGMRLLPAEQQAEILLQTCNFFRTHSHFKLEEKSAVGPCGSSVRIITGEEEGLFGWIAVNYLMDGFMSNSPKGNRTTYGFLDMGGASTQIAFEPGEAYQLDHPSSNDLINVRLRLLGGEEIRHNVFVATWLGYGTNQARERYVGIAINDFEASRTEEDTEDVVPDPCLPKHLELAETPVHSGVASDHAKKMHRLSGTGSFEQCMQKTSTLLNKDAPCPDTPCLMNGIHVPPIDFSVSHFIGVSEYWFSSEHIFGLGGPYNFVEYERAASTFCSREWDDIVRQHEQSQRPHSGDGEVEGKDGQIVGVGHWGPQVEIPRLQMQCFKAAWIANVLHEGIGLPRIVDPGGNSTSDRNKVAEQAEEKGLGRPTFQSVDTVGNIAISWTLGKMVLEASREVPPLQKNAKPIVDPIDDVPDLDISPIKPIRPFSIEAIENQISPHLPYPLQRSSLGFSPVILLYIIILFLFFLLTWPLLRKARSVCLRSIRRVSRRDTDAYSMEEGTFLNGFTDHSSIPSSRKQWLPTAKLFSTSPRTRTRSRSNRPPKLTLSSNTQRSHNKDLTPTRVSPSHSYSLPSVAVSTSSSRSSSPLPSPGFEATGSLYHSRSRNGSTMSLNNSIVPRTISRVNSSHSLVADGRQFGE